ncbi:uncharacterized protein LOC124475904 [Hypomesus transpacificus]|uniref:uncharacterized protein LOC124475904 n=1 Tax=Hypomesus transpacificus TaxID=137520 RepID=UPI001F072F10|nr:uncharacterized protein LOC124475904 [Hypomesus transpacificus]
MRMQKDENWTTPIFYLDSLPKNRSLSQTAFVIFGVYITIRWKPNMPENPVRDSGQESSVGAQKPEKPDSHETSVGPDQSSMMPSQTSLLQKRLFAELGLITFRRQQLHSRRLMLLQMQKFKRKGKRSQGPEDSEQPGELEPIQQELEELVEREKKLIELMSDISGGVYICPPSIPEDYSEAEEPPPLPVAVEKLSTAPAVVQCPSCDQIITTETLRKVGGTARLLCVMCSLLGCLAGCCLIPFCVKSLWDVHHHCPMCHAQIHIFRRL